MIGIDVAILSANQIIEPNSSFACAYGQFIIACPFDLTDIGIASK